MSMMQLPLVAFLISTLLIILFFSRKTIKTTETAIYSGMLIINFLFSMFSIIIIILAMLGVNNTIIGLFQKIYLSLMILLTFLILIYNLSLIGITSKKGNIILQRIHKKV